MESAEHNPAPDRDDPKVSSTVLIGVVGVVLLLAVVLFTMALYYSSESAQVATKVYERPAREVTALRQEQQELLNAYRWVNESAQVAAIPIGRAMELTAQDLQAGLDPTRIIRRGQAGSTTQPADTAVPATQPAEGTP